MRSLSKLLLLAALLSGCLSDPTGKTKSWPQSGTVNAGAAFDLDGDGTSEALLTTSGGSPDGVYLFKGGTDIKPQPGLAQGFSDFGSLGSIGARAEILVADVDPSRAGPELLVADSTDSGMRLSVLSGGDLSLIKSVSWTRGGKTDLNTLPPPTITTAPFGAEGLAIFVTSGDEIHFISASKLLSAADPQMLQFPPPTQGPWNVWAIGQLGNQPTSPVIVATTDGVWTATPNGGPLSFDRVRTGNAWVAQLLADLDGDGKPEVVGLQAGSPASICAFNAKNAMTQCLATNLNIPAQTFVTMKIAEVTGGAPSDVLLSFGAPGGQASVIPGLKWDGTSNTLTAAGAATTPFAIPSSSRILVGRFTEPGGTQVLYVGSDGHFECGHTVNNTFTKCSAN